MRTPAPLHAILFSTLFSTLLVGGAARAGGSPDGPPRRPPQSGQQQQQQQQQQSPQRSQLAGLSRSIADMLAVDVCSIYLKESLPREDAPTGGDADEADAELVLHATHGFPQEAVGKVRMRVGEGLTGVAVKCLRPVSVAAAPGDARNTAFEALHEERFPALCALPLVDGGRAVGALVRRSSRWCGFRPASSTRRA